MSTQFANNLFFEHIERSVKFGGRSANSVINYYLVNPHYLSISIKTLFEWMDKYKLDYYSMTPNIELPFSVDSPYHAPILKNSTVYKKYLTILELRWIFAQLEDEKVYGEIFGNMSNLDKNVNSLLSNLNEVLQNFQYEKKYLNNIISDIEKITTDIEEELGKLNSYILNNFNGLKSEFIKTLEMIVNKVENNEEFDLSYKNEKLFKGYNGLTTNYIMFHKKN